MDKNSLIKDDFNYLPYILEFNLHELLGIKEKELLGDPSRRNSRKSEGSGRFSLEIKSDEKFLPEFDDLSRLHYIVRSRKVTTILEFGVGKSSLIFADALKLNKKDFYSYSSKNLRRNNLYECHSVDNYKYWIDQCKQDMPEQLFAEGFLNFQLAEVEMGDFLGRACTFYNPLPNISPDLIYLDGPDQFSVKGNIRGISTNNKDRMPMSADILAFEHFLQPGTLIVVDGRAANARFLKTNLQRNWTYYFCKEWDQHFFELLEEPLGIYNKRFIEHTLGEDYFKRLER
tara:strand:+ start:250 stop:1110 length:861 start_codon:yes stop_codon:yes gene_type:complete